MRGSATAAGVAGVSFFPPPPFALFLAHPIVVVSEESVGNPFRRVTIRTQRRSRSAARLLQISTALGGRAGFFDLFFPAILSNSGQP